MEVPRLGVESEVAAAGLRHSSQQCQILNPTSEAKDQTCILMDTSGVCNLLNHKGNSQICVFNLGKYEDLLSLTGSGTEIEMELTRNDLKNYFNHRALTTDSLKMGIQVFHKCFKGNKK